MALTTDQMAQVRLLFADADSNDLDKIANMFNAARRSAENSIKNEFSVGQKVTWVSTRIQRPMAGTITKINRRQWARGSRAKILS